MKHKNVYVACFKTLAVTTSAVYRGCINETDPYRLVFPTLGDCVGLGKKYPNYKNYNFFVHDNYCCFNIYDYYVTAISNDTTCYCLTDNCNDIAYQPSPNTVGKIYTKISLVVAIAMAATVMPAKFAELL